jgi:AraC-like DNA-binding protein
LNTAQRLLREDLLSIKEIAVLLGFCNTAHFSNAFRRAEGITPSDFRRRARGEAVQGRLSSRYGSKQIH